MNISSGLKFFLFNVMPHSTHLTLMLQITLAFTGGCINFTRCGINRKRSKCFTPVTFGKSHCYSHKQDYATRVEIFNLKSLEHQRTQCGSILGFKVVPGFFNIPLLRKFQFASYRSLRAHQFQLAKKCCSTNNVFLTGQSFNSVASTVTAT